MKEIIIRVDKKGNPKIEGHGFEGSECEHHLGEIERELGGNITSIEQKGNDNENCIHTKG